jgi:dipeptidyl-peptidase-4
MLTDEEEEKLRSSELREYRWNLKRRALLLISEKSLAWFDLDTHTSRTVVTGSDELINPVISPDGRTIAFVRKHALWVADSTTGNTHIVSVAGNSDLLEGEPDWVYSHELGMNSAYWWSPDSSSIAWLETNDSAVDKYILRNSDRDEYAIAYPKPGATIPTLHLFVRTLATHRLLQVDLGRTENTYIPRVQWLPNGKHLAIERLSRDQKTLDLLIADAATGKSHVVLTDKDDYWINLSDDLHFLSDSRRFIWSSERSGYRHLYLYDVSGRQLSQITKGNWEVTSLVGTDDAAEIVYFIATEATPLERQLYKVRFDGTDLTRITKKPGTHKVLISPLRDGFVDTYSDSVTPPRIDILRMDGSSIAVLNDNVPANIVEKPVVTNEFVMVKNHLGMDLNASMMKPPDFNPARKYPVILYVAGGPGEQIVKNAWGGDVSIWLGSMARKGYIVFAMDGRGSGGRGHLFDEPVHLRFSSAEMADLRDEVRYLRSLSWIDKSRVGIFGVGYGGFLVLHGMLDKPLLFKAGFSGSPITDWHLYDAVFAERYLEDPARNQDGWLSSSPLENAKNLTAPLLLAQASGDETVHQENSFKLLDELLDNNKYAEILLFPDRRDLFEDYGARITLFQRLTDFFMSNL